MRKMSYDVLIPCRDEEERIGLCLSALFSQTIQPSRVLIVDDGSMDLSAYVYGNYPVRVLFLLNRRAPIRGVNYALALRSGLRELLREIESASYLLKLDADTVLENPNYARELISVLEDNPKIGITGGISHLDKVRKYVNDGAKMYRVECLRELLASGGYPLKSGSDLILQFRAKNLGWGLAPRPLVYRSLRPYKRTLRRWIAHGRLRRERGFNIPHLFLKTIFNLMEPPLIVGALVSWFSYFIHHLTVEATRDLAYMGDHNRDAITTKFARVKRRFAKGSI